MGENLIANWPRKLSNNDLAQEVEDAEAIYLAELNYMNSVGEESAGMLPDGFAEIVESVAKWRKRYDLLTAEISRRIRDGEL